MNNLRLKIIDSPYRTQEKFAEATKINEGLLSKYCRGLRKPSAKHLVIIKKALKLK